MQHEDEEEPEEEDQNRPALQRAAQAQLQRRATSAHDLGVHQADQGDEQADAHADRGLQVRGHGLEDGLTEAREHQDEDDDALNDHQAHGVGIGHAVHAYQGVGDHRVDAQARGQRHREVGHQAHEDRHDAGDEGRAGRDLLGGAQRGDAVVRGGEDEGVEDEDVAHREEGDEPAPHLTSHGGTALCDVEETVKRAGRGGRGAGTGGCGWCTHVTGFSQSEADGDNRSAASGSQLPSGHRLGVTPW
ncbi:MAG: hypothetical protein Q605_AUC00938G0004 [Actinomyces urogenitalis DORA_12]|uniref:Uncharacterized protein n=1 Tax=Actinomyces urogenitalis DORA_12 TaxID=1403939 RepID=W1VA09_9ACTO|nr:MAG: hypothetical protein Q605_AUC00938G0004 [Actinomyces urogenitalis DORA_12]